MALKLWINLNIMVITYLVKFIKQFIIYFFCMT